MTEYSNAKIAQVKVRQVHALICAKQVGNIRHFFCHRSSRSLCLSSRFPGNVGEIMGSTLPFGGSGISLSDVSLRKLGQPLQEFCGIVSDSNVLGNGYPDRLLAAGGTNLYFVAYIQYICVKLLQLI